LKVCHVCAFSCPDDAEICPLCGAELLDSDGEIEEIEEELVVEIENPELVASIAEPIVAEIFCDKLKENEILFTSDEPDLSSSMQVGFGGFFTKINIYVSALDLEKATEIYENLDVDSISFEEDFDEEE